MSGMCSEYKRHFAKERTDQARFIKRLRNGRPQSLRWRVVNRHMWIMIDRAEGMRKDMWLFEQHDLAATNLGANNVQSSSGL
jgi:hypothetical protein